MRDFIVFIVLNLHLFIEHFIITCTSQFVCRKKKNNKRCR